MQTAILIKLVFFEEKMELVDGNSFGIKVSGFL
jgi:hypothetical protein